jgi:hypothetical protein
MTVTEFQRQSANDAVVTSISFSKTRRNHKRPKDQAHRLAQGSKLHFFWPKLLLLPAVSE